MLIKRKELLEVPKRENEKQAQMLEDSRWNLGSMNNGCMRHEERVAQWWPNLVTKWPAWLKLLSSWVIPLRIKVTKSRLSKHCQYAFDRARHDSCKAGGASDRGLPLLAKIAKLWKQVGTGFPLPQQTKDTITCLFLWNWQWGQLFPHFLSPWNPWRLFKVWNKKKVGCTIFQM